MVLDSTVMNVSISTIVDDLGTTVSGLQAAITFYTLTMAALMLTGGKLGDVWGRMRAFRIGAIVYAIGSLITAISPNLTTLFIGWSIVEGLGAVLVIPAIAALIAINYKGKDRVVGYTIIGATSGIAVALGPLIGGYMTTYLSWRYVFLAETLIMAVVLLYSRKMKKVPRPAKAQKIDIPSVLLSASGMALFVLGILQSKTWGWVTPRAIPEINGQEVAPLGVSVVAYILLAGATILYMFYKRQIKLENEKKNPLLQVSILKVRALRSGLGVLSGQYLITAAIFFVIPIYLQMVLGLNALQTGIKIIPLSFGIVIFSMYGSKLSSKKTARSIVKIGQGLLIIGSIVLLSALNTELRGFLFGSSLFIVGAGLGLLVSQIGNVNMSSVDEDKSSEVGGLQGTFQNLGASLGTALIGSVMITSLTTNFSSEISQNSAVSEQIKTSIIENSKGGIPIASVPDIESAAAKAGLSNTESKALAESYGAAQMNSLKASMFFLVVLAILTLTLSTGIPNKKAVS
jgi:MFS family permease